MYEHLIKSKLPTFTGTLPTFYPYRTRDIKLSESFEMHSILPIYSERNIYIYIYIYIYKISFIYQTKCLVSYDIIMLLLFILYSKGIANN